MMKYTAEQAKTDLTELLQRACAGEEVIIAQEDGSEFKLRPIKKAVKKRVLGRLAGQISYSEDLFAPLTDQELKDLGFE